MPQGLEILDASGNVTLSVTTYVGAFSGSFATGGADTGTHTNTSLIGRSLLHFVPVFDGVYGGPNVTLNPSTGIISWAYTLNSGSGASGDRQHTVYYGGY